MLVKKYLHIYLIQNKKISLKKSNFIRNLDSKSGKEFVKFYNFGNFV